MLIGFVALAGVGCVPIRQYIGGNGRADSPDKSQSQGGTKSEFESPDDYKNTDRDAWKDEMEGTASWYGEDFNGRLTAKRRSATTCTNSRRRKNHCPWAQWSKVTNLENGKTVEVKVNDRGPLCQREQDYRFVPNGWTGYRHEGSGYGQGEIGNCPLAEKR